MGYLQYTVRFEENLAFKPLTLEEEPAIEYPTYWQWVVISTFIGQTGGSFSTDKAFLKHQLNMIRLNGMRDFDRSPAKCRLQNETALAMLRAYENQL